MLERNHDRLKLHLMMFVAIIAFKIASINKTLTKINEIIALMSRYWILILLQLKPETS
jgi:hypothetical protein